MNMDFKFGWFSFSILKILFTLLFLKFSLLLWLMFVFCTLIFPYVSSLTVKNLSIIPYFLYLVFVEHHEYELSLDLYNHCFFNK